MKYIFATNNAGKVKEIAALFAEAQLELVSLAETGYKFIPPETGDSFRENAIQKAAETAAFLRERGIDSPIIADDSGLVIDALEGALGVHTALFMGDAPQEAKNRRILEMMKGVENRSARFVSVIACVSEGKVLTTEGVIEGCISKEIRGEGGFGYDPIFYLPECGKTMAELTAMEKNRISHRGQALSAMVQKLKEA